MSSEVPEESESSDVFSIVNLYPASFLDASGTLTFTLNLKVVFVLPVIVLVTEVISSVAG